VLVDDRSLRVIEPVTGEIFAEHTLVAPGEASIADAHYGGPRPDRLPRQAALPKPRQRRCSSILAWSAEAALTGAAAAGVTKLTTEIGEILPCKLPTAPRRRHPFDPRRSWCHTHATAGRSGRSW